MTVRYRLYSEAFGEYLEKMGGWFIREFIHTLSISGKKNNWSHFFSVSWELTGEYNNNRVYYIDVTEEISLDDVISRLHKGYVNFFATVLENFDYEYEHRSIGYTLENSSWDKYHKSYLPVFKIQDHHFYQYHEKLLRSPIWRYPR